MQAIKAVLTAIVLSFVLVACSDDGSNKKIIAAKEGIVMIAAEKIQNGETGAGLGTGFFIGENKILTNKHVVEDSSKILVALETSEPYDAELVFADPVSDLAVIKIKDWDKFKAENHYRILEFANPDDFEVTQEIYTVGHPWGLTWSVSKGILTAIDRKMGPTPKILIQTDAHVYNGNSGGPMLNNDGEVMGVNSIMIANTGGSYGFALPIDMVEKVLKDFERWGEARWSYLGMMLDNSGVIKEVNAGSPAAAGGLKVGDKILRYETSNGPQEEMEKTLPVAIATHDPEVPLKVVVQRGDEEVTLTFKAGSKRSEDYGDATAKP